MKKLISLIIAIAFALQVTGASSSLRTTNYELRTINALRPMSTAVSSAGGGNPLVIYDGSSFPLAETRSTISALIKKMLDPHTEWHIMRDLGDVVRALALANPIAAEEELTNLISSYSRTSKMAERVAHTQAMISLIPAVSQTAAEAQLPQVVSIMLKDSSQAVGTHLASAVRLLAKAAPSVADSEFKRITELIETGGLDVRVCSQALLALAPSVSAKEAATFFKRLIRKAIAARDTTCRYNLIKIVKVFIKLFPEESRQEFKRLVGKLTADNIEVLEALAPAVTPQLAAEQLPNLINAFIKKGSALPGISLSRLITKTAKRNPAKASQQFIRIIREFFYEEEHEARFSRSEVILALAPALDAATAKEQFPQLFSLLFTEADSGKKVGEERIFEKLAMAIAILSNSAPDIADSELRNIVGALISQEDPFVRTHLSAAIDILALARPAVAGELFEQLTEVFLKEPDNELRIRQAEALNALALSIKPNVAELILPRFVEHHLQEPGYKVQQQLVELIGLLKIIPLIQRLLALDNRRLGVDSGNEATYLHIFREGKAIRLLLLDAERETILLSIFFNPVVDWKTGQVDYLYMRVETEPHLSSGFLRECLELVRAALEEASAHPAMADVKIHFKGPDWLAILGAIVTEKTQALPGPEGGEGDGPAGLGEVVGGMDFKSIVEGPGSTTIIPARRTLPDPKSSSASQSPTQFSAGGAGLPVPKSVLKNIDSAA